MFLLVGQSSESKLVKRPRASFNAWGRKVACVEGSTFGFSMWGPVHYPKPLGTWAKRFLGMAGV
jgi:hypothetical protein